MRRGRPLDSFPAPAPEVSRVLTLPLSSYFPSRPSVQSQAFWGSWGSRSSHPGGSVIPKGGWPPAQPCSLLSRILRVFSPL